MTSTNERPPSWSVHNAAAFQLDDVVEHYHLRSPYPSSLFPFLLELAVTKGGPVLELGCGTGEITVALAPHVERISDLEVPPAAIIVRISFESTSEPPHAALGRLRDRPPVVAIAWEDEEVAEAARLGCEVVLKAPREVSKLCEALGRLVGT